MDFAALRHSLDAYDYHLFAVGQTEVTVSALVKLAISAAVLYFIAGRFSRWTLNRLLAAGLVDKVARGYWRALNPPAAQVITNLGIPEAMAAMKERHDRESLEDKLRLLKSMIDRRRAVACCRGGEEARGG